MNKYAAFIMCGTVLFVVSFDERNDQYDDGCQN